MRTLLSWLIANIEVIFILIICIISARFLFAHWDDMTQASAGGFIILTGVLCWAMAPKKFIYCLFTLLFFAILDLIIIANDPGNIRGLLVPPLVFGILVAIFTAINMDEVVSRRMLYINSNTSMFELTLLYVINRFTTSFAGLTTTLIV